MRRPLASPGRARSIGQAAGAGFTFSATDYVPPDIQNDINTGRSYYDAAKAASNAISFGPRGSVNLSPAAQEAVQGVIMATVAATFSAAIPGAGAVLALAYELAPKAGPGPGVCATDPPAGPYLAQLQAWSHFTTWASFWGPYAPGAPGSFEEFAYPVLEYNWLLGANCHAEKTVAAPLLLASLVASWNAVHPPTGHRTICRTVTPAAFSGQQYDPIAEALSEAAYVKYTPALPPAPTFEDVTNQTYNGPRTLPVCFAVNTGPLQVKVSTLFQGVYRSKVPVPVSAPLTSSSKTSPVLVVAGGLAAVGVWAVATKGGTAGAMRWLKSILR